MTGEFNRLIEFIGRCSASDLEKTPEYITAAGQLDDARQRIATEKDRNKKAKLEAQLRKAERSFEKALSDATGQEKLDEWLLEGIGFFIKLFMPNRLLLSTYPYEHLPDFQVLANLKHNCFVDGDLDTVLHAYGNRPTVPLTVLGLITSAPPPDGDAFDPLTEKPTSVKEAASDEEGFELGFRRLFSSFDGFYKFISYSRFPNITVHPIAVYRSVGKVDEDPR